MNKPTKDAAPRYSNIAFATEADIKAFHGAQVSGEYIDYGDHWVDAETGECFNKLSEISPEELFILGLN